MRKLLSLTLCLLTVLATARQAHAVKIADITRIAGQRTSVLTGLGLVVGLKGTGDGGDFAAAINPLAQMLKGYEDQVGAKDLVNANNVAVVSVTAMLPANGVRDGDHLDVYVTSIGASPSLKGGRLFVTLLTGPVQGLGVLAMATGPIVTEDPSTPTVGVVKGGAVMEADIQARFIDNGQFTLILEDPAASWGAANTIAKMINDSEANNGAMLASVVDPKNVVVVIPPSERQHPDNFISRVLRLPVPLLPEEARVQINVRTSTMIVTGDVEISPVVISHKGLTISTILPTPQPSVRSPLVQTNEVVLLDTTKEGGTKLQDLVGALDQLKVPAEDRITIIKELYKTGKLHAKLIEE